MMKGLPGRMQAEIADLAALGTEVSVIARSERQYSVWTGGQIVVGMPSCEQRWDDKAEYDESGQCSFLFYDLFWLLCSCSGHTIVYRKT